MKSQVIKKIGFPREVFKHDLATLLEIPLEKRNIIQEAILENVNALWDVKVREDVVLSLTAKVALPTSNIIDVLDATNFVLYSLGQQGDTLEVYLDDIAEGGYLDTDKIDEVKTFLDPLTPFVEKVKSKRRVREFANWGPKVRSFGGICELRHVRPREFEGEKDEIDKYTPEKGQLVPVAIFEIKLSSHPYEQTFGLTSDELDLWIKGMQAIKKELDMLTDSFPEAER